MSAAMPAPPSAAQPKTSVGLNKPPFFADASAWQRTGETWRRERSSSTPRLHTLQGAPGVPRGQPWPQGPRTQTEALLRFLTTRSQRYLKNVRFAFQHPAAGPSQGDGISDGCKHEFLGMRRVNRCASKKEDWDYLNHLQHDKIKIRIPHKTENNAQPFRAARLGQPWRKVYLGCGLTQSQ